jgi:hypothetical protein
MAKFGCVFIYGWPDLAECTVAQYVYTEVLAPPFPPPRDCDWLPGESRQLIERYAKPPPPSACHIVQQTGSRDLRSPKLPIARNLLTSHCSTAASSKPERNKPYVAAITLFSTFLAAYACVSVSGTQIPISQVPIVNATLIEAGGAEYTIPIPVDMSLVYTNKARLDINNLDEDKANGYLDNVLSVSHIETTGASCTFCGVDGAEVVTNSLAPGLLGDEDDVRPPQRIFLPSVHKLLRLAILMEEMFVHWHDWARRCWRNDETIS